MSAFDFLRALLLLAPGAALAGPAALAETGWHVMETPRFRLVSQVSAREARAWATEFDQFITEIGTKIAVDESLLPPLTVVLFADPRGFAPYALTRPDGRHREIAGFFASRETWSIIGLPEQFDDDETRHAVFHEGTHWYVQGAPVDLPLWMNEGLAEVFSTFAASRERCEWGRPINPYVRLLKKSAQLPLDRLLVVTDRDPLFNDAGATRLFYAESWAFVHYAMFGVRHGDANALNRFLTARSNGRDLSEALGEAFAADEATMDRELANYLRNGSYRTFSRRLAKETRLATPYPVAPPGTVQVALARLALGGGHRERARTHIDRALALLPDQPDPHELLALLLAENGDNGGAAAAAQAALAHGSQDAWMHVLCARGSQEKAAASGDAAAARQVADSYERAINLRRNLRAAYAGLGSILETVEPVTGYDRQFLVMGRRQFPDCGEILLGLAALAHKNGNRADAREALALLQAPAGHFPPALQGHAAELEALWALGDAQEQIRAAVRARDWSGALAELDRVLQTSVRPEVRSGLLQQRAQLAGAARLDAACRAFEQKRFPDADRILEELVAMPGAPENILAGAREMLVRVRQLVGSLPAAAPAPAP